MLRVNSDGWSWAELADVTDDETPQNMWLFVSVLQASGGAHVYLAKWTRGGEVVWEAPEPGVPAPDLESAPDLPWQVAEFVLEHYRNKVQLAPMRYGWFGMVQQRKEDE